MIYNKYLHDTTSSTARLVVQWLYYGIIQWVLPIGYGSMQTGVNVHLIMALPVSIIAGDATLAKKIPDIIANIGLSAIQNNCVNNSTIDDCYFLIGSPLPPFRTVLETPQCWRHHSVGDTDSVLLLLRCSIFYCVC